MHFNKWYRAYNINMSRLSNDHYIDIIDRCYATSGSARALPSTTAGLLDDARDGMLLCVVYIQLLNQMLFSCATCTSQASTTSGPRRLHSSTRRRPATILSHPRRHHVQVHLLVAFPCSSIPRLVDQRNSRKKEYKSISTIPPPCCRSCCSTRQTTMSHLYRSFDRQSPMISCLCIVCCSATESVSNEAKRIKKTHGGFVAFCSSFVYLLNIRRVINRG